MIYSIEVKDLSVFVGSTRLIGPVNFKVQLGGTLVVMGETGAGKSLVVQAINGTLPSALHSEGEIKINGRRMNELSYAKRSSLWGRNISTLPQEPWRALDPLMRSFLQVKEAHRFVAQQSPVEATKASKHAFKTLGLRGAEQLFPNTLSGGMAQRVAFAAATAANAEILLADEPTKGLDAVQHANIISLLTNIPKQGGTLIAITHEASVARHLGGDMLVLRDGSVVEQGKVKSILDAPKDNYTRSLLDADPQNWPEHTTQKKGKLLLKATNLTISRGNKRLFERFNFKLHAGEKLALTGPSGIGKTSLLDALAGLLKSNVGILHMHSSLSKHCIQKLYQDPPAAFPNRVVLSKTLKDVARLHKTHWPDVLGILKQLGIHPSLLDRRPDEVSGGELQRISIARALSVKPKILLADEPTSRLDPITQRETLAMLGRISYKHQIAIVLVTHDHNIAQKWAHRTIKLL